MKTASCRRGLPLVALLASSLPLLPGCAVESASEPPEERVAQADETIVGGSVEPGFDAVVALIDQQGGACTGTIVAKNGSTGYVLTAAHCTGMDFVIQADNYNDCFQGGNQANCQAVYPVEQQIFHPSYNDADPSQGYDFSMIRFSGANANTPVIPAAAPSDGVGVATNLLAVGYGITSANNTGNSLRRSVNFSVAQLDSILIVDDQTDGKGSCSGDSGGPALYNGEVVGVVSFGDQNCTQIGAYGRVQAVYNDFVAPFIGGQVVETCDSCFDSEVNQPNGACAPTVEACFNDTACAALIECVNGCNTDACVQGCADQNPNGITKFNAIFDCWCQQCADICADQCAGGSSSASTSASASTGSGVGNTTSGVGGAGGAGGAGGSAGTGDGGSNNNNDDSNDDGGGTTTVTECACSTPGSATSDPVSVVGVFGLALGALARRRRRNA